MSYANMHSCYAKLHVVQPSKVCYTVLLGWTSCPAKRSWFVHGQMIGGIMIRWINTNPNAQPDERGYWESYEQRFTISPNYRHTIYPDSYTVRDYLKNTETTHDRVKDCKWWAEQQIRRQ